MHGYVLSLVVLNICDCLLWDKGVIHYVINNKDYDVHSQEVITTTLSKLQEEICVKFFLQTGNASSKEEKLLYITNPDKIKPCQPNKYDFDSHIILMPIGYRCLNSKAVARYAAEMLRASIMHTVTTINSYDLIQKFQEKDLDPSRPTLLSAIDRNFINAHYHLECGALTRASRRGSGDVAGGTMQLSAENIAYYEHALWPLGVVLYAVEGSLRDTKAHAILRYAMTAIELATCIVFEEYKDAQILSPKSLLWFMSDGEDTPLYGFQNGSQTINLNKMAFGAPGHSSHAINNLMRVLGVHMMSNRFDRDNYISVNWKNVVRGKEYLLEKAPQEAWVVQMPYDFDSATHAPVNYVCQGCELGSTTIQPLQDHLWQRTMSMGHKTELSDLDVQFLNMLYGKQCQNRFVSRK